MKPLIAGIWALIASLGTTYAVVFTGSTPPPGVPHEEKAELEVQKTRVISVPMISGGAVQGFVVAQFAFTVDPKKAKAFSASPDVFLLDEAFRKIYTDDHLDFAHLEKYNVSGLTSFLVAATNKRLGVDLVHDVLVQDFRFVSRDEASQ